MLKYIDSNNKSLIKSKLTTTCVFRARKCKNLHIKYTCIGKVMYA